MYRLPSRYTIRKNRWQKWERVLSVSANLSTWKHYKGNCNTTRAVITREKARVAILVFHHFKIPDMDEIFPAMMKEGIQRLDARRIKNFFLANFPLGNVLTFSQKVNVVLIPKLGKGDYSDSKNFERISLRSPLLTWPCSWEGAKVAPTKRKPICLKAWKVLSPARKITESSVFKFQRERMQLWKARTPQGYS